MFEALMKQDKDAAQEMLKQAIKLRWLKEGSETAAVNEGWITQEALETIQSERLQEPGVKVPPASASVDPVGS